MKPPTIGEFLAFRREYYDQQNQTERFGQAFCNKFDYQDSKLFYMEQDGDAQDYIDNLLLPDYDPVESFG